MTIQESHQDHKTARHFVLAGKVILHQNTEGGHRAGLDAVMLAASVKSEPDTALHVVDLGAGVGTAGLCVAARCDTAHVVLVENDPATLRLTRSTLLDPENMHFSKRATVLAADIALRGNARRDAGLLPNMADHVIMNPPYWMKAKVRPSPDPQRIAAHILDDDGLNPWFRTAASIVKPGGGLSVIFPTEGLEDILSAMRGRFGAITVFPLYKGAHEAASRVIVTGIRASRAPMRLLPGLILHEEQKCGHTRREWTPQANAVLNGEAGLFI